MPSGHEILGELFGYLIIIIALCILVIPIGVGLIFGRINRGLHFSIRLFLCFFSGSAVVIITWIWMYLIGFSIRDIGRVVLVIWVACLLWVAKCSLGNRFRGMQQMRGVIETGLAATLLITSSFVFYVAPRTVDALVVPRQRMGPDALGYINAADALLNDGSFADLRDSAIQRSGFKAEYELFDWSILGVHAIPEKSLSIKTEFIVGALRIGFPAIVASITELVGYKHLLSVLYLVSSMYVAFGGLLVFGWARTRGLKIIPSLVLALVSMVNVNLLAGHHEGGVAQSFSYSAVAGILISATMLNLSSGLTFTIFYLSGIHLLSSYVDMYFVICALIPLWYIFARLRTDDDSRRRVRLLTLSWVLSAVTLLPLTVKLPWFIFRRAGDARQAGWVWTNWTELTGILGISNPYDFQPDSIIGQLVLIGSVFLIYRIVVDKRGQTQLKAAQSLTFAIGTLTFSFYFYSRYVADFSNYQWYKLVGTFLGPSVMILGAAIVLPNPLSSLRTRVSRVSAIAIITMVGFLAINTSTNFARQYWKESSFVDSESFRALAEPKLKHELANFVLFGRYGWEELALTPFWEASYLNRRDMGVVPYPPSGESVGLVVKLEACEGWACLSEVPRENLIIVSSDYRIIDLGLDSGELRSKSPYFQWIKVNRALSKLNAPFVAGNWSDLSDELSYRGG